MNIRLLVIAAAALISFSAPAFAKHGDNGGSSAVAVSGSRSSANNAGNRQSTNFNDKYQAPGVSAPGLAATGQCPVGSVSFGISGPGAGLSFGFTKGDKACRDLYLINQAGYGRAVMRQYLVDEVPEIRRAVFPNSK